MSSDFYQVEKLIGRKTEGDRVYFRVKWSGYSSAYNSWEPEENLSNCKDLIEEFMDREASKEKRRTLRASPARSKKALAAVALSSDDEIATATKVAKKKQVAKKSPLRQTKVMAKQQNQPLLSTPLEAGLFGREYQLRSRDSKSHQLLSSDDEESSPIVVRKTKKDTTASKRMTLTESNFKRRLADVNKQLPVVAKATSTPQPKNPTNQSPQPVKTKLKFDSSQLRRSGRLSGPVLTIERVTEEESSKKTPVENNLSIIEEAEEEAFVKEESPIVEEDGGENYPAWPPVGWKEFALAAFVTGLAAVGYVCYTTDYCSFC